MRVHPARDPATIRAPRGATRWLVYAAIAAVVVALLSLVATAVALWLSDNPLTGIIEQDASEQILLLV